MSRAGLCLGATVALTMLIGAAASGAGIEAVVSVNESIGAVYPLNYGDQIEAKMEYDQKIKDFYDWLGVDFIRLWGGSNTSEFLWDEPRDSGCNTRYPCFCKEEGDACRNGACWNQSVWGDTDDAFDWLNARGVLGSHVLVTVPIVESTPERVANWVDYINNVRGEGVVYWMMGAEPYGNWDCAYQRKPENYADIINTYGAAMKAVDPTIKIVASLGGAYYDGRPDFDRKVINLAADMIDVIGYDWYPGAQLDYSDPAAAAVWVTGNVLALRPKVIDRYNQMIEEEAPHRVGQIEIALPEMDGAVDAPSADLPPYEQDIVQWGVGNMLFWARYLGEAQKQGIAFSNNYSFQECPFGMIRGWAVEGGWGGNPWDGVTVRGKAYAIKLYSERFRGTVVEADTLGSDTFYKPMQWREETYEGDVPYVAAYSALNPNDDLCVMVINCHPTEARTVTLDIGGYDVTGSTATLYDIGGTASSITAQNDYDYGAPSGEIQITESTIGAGNTITYAFPAHSCTAVVLSGSPGTGPDQTSPTLAITSPSPGAGVSGTIEITGTADDNASVATVEVRIDDGAYDLASGTTNWSYTWDTTTVPDGEHTITAKATDTSGNIEVAQVSVNVLNAGGEMVDVFADSASPHSGEIISGSVTDLQADDEVYMQVRSGRDGSGRKLRVTLTVANCGYTPGEVGSLNYEFNGHAIPSNNYSISFYNYTSKEYDGVGGGTIGEADVTFAGGVDDGSPYIASTGEMKVFISGPHLPKGSADEDLFMDLWKWTLEILP